MKVLVFDTIELLYEKLLEEFLTEIKNNPEINLGLATGSTTELLYKGLILDHLENKTSYKDVKVFNLDEYVGLDKEHPQSYAYFMKESLFKHLDINLDNTFIPNGATTNFSLELANYDQLLKDNQIDLQLLGIGPNSHIAFNEPGSSFDSKTSLVELTEETRMANSRFFNDLDEVPTQALTMGIGSILNAKRIILVATGPKKAQAIKDTIEGVITTNIPSSILRIHPNIQIYLDKEAAKLLDI